MKNVLVASFLCLFALPACHTDAVVGDRATSSGSSGSTGTGSTGSTSSGSTGSSGTTATSGTTGSTGGTSGTTGTTVMVTTLAGNGTQGFADGTGGPTGTAELGTTRHVALDAAGNVYVADVGNSRIRKIDHGGNVTTLAGNGTPGFADGTGGPNGTAEFFSLSGVAMDAAGNAYVADYLRIRKVDPSGNVTTLAGNGTRGFADGSGGTAEFNDPRGVAVDSSGNVYVADYQNNRIRKVDPSGNVTTLAGNGTAGFADGTGGPNGTAEFAWPVGVAVDASGNVYVADGRNDRIRKIDSSGNVTTVAGDGMVGDADGTGGPNGTAEFQWPSDVAIDVAGHVFVADRFNNRVRKIDLLGNVTTLAGNGTAGFADGTGGRDGTAELNDPQGVAVDSAGKVYVADTGNYRIRLITP